MTASLGLPPAPSIFGDAEWGGDLSDPGLFSFDFQRRPQGPPPDPHTVFSPPNAKLYPFQEEGLQFLLRNRRALLGDEMGLGKSIQAIAALRLLMNRGEVKKALILCPRTLVADWSAKFRQWAPDLKHWPVEGKRKQRDGVYQYIKVPIFITGYETWREDYRAKRVDPADFDLVILDEVQRIKNPGTVLHQTVAQIGADWRWGLSGTPLENNVGELLGIFAYLQPGLLPSEGNYPVRALQKAIAPYFLRRRKEDVLDLPPKNVREVWLELTPAQRQAYDLAKAEIENAFGGDYRRLNPFLHRLKQICNRWDDHSCKVDFLIEELRRLQQAGEKAVIFSQYPEVTLKPLLHRLEEFDVFLLDGSMRPSSRQWLVNCFQSHDRPRCLAVSLKCGGVGLTLTRATHVYHFDPWWHPAARQQAEDRTHRIGQDKPVHVTQILTRGTVEERIHQLMQSKEGLIKQVCDLEDEELHDFDLAEALSPGDLAQLFH